MTPDALDVLRDIKFSIYAVAQQFPPGSSERRLLRILDDSVSKDIDYAIAQVEAERKERNP